MLKLLKKVLLLLLVLSVFSGQIVFLSPATVNASTIISQVTTLSNGKKVVLVDGNPFEIHGATIRVDHRRYNQPNIYPYHTAMTNQQMTDLGIFKWARQMNVNTVQIPVLWKDSEPTKGSYDWTNLDWAINECLKYGLRMEILWFGSNVCGGAHDVNVPDYIINDTSTYSRRVKADGTPFPNGWHGDGINIYYLCHEDTDTLAREQAVVQKMMQHLDSYDTSNVVIGIQTENEPSLDMGVWDRCHCTTCNNLYTSGGYSGYAAFIKDRNVNFINKVAGWVKTSQAKQRYTRINLCGWTDHDIVKFTTNAPNLDLINYDAYGWGQSGLYNFLRSELSNNGNAQMLAELGIDDSNFPTLQIQTLAVGGYGSSAYKLEAAWTGTDNYLLNPDGTEHKTYVQEARDTYGLFEKTTYFLASMLNSPLGISYFNVEGSTSTNYNGSKIINGVNVNYSTSNRGVGMAFSVPGAMTFMSAKAGSFTVTGSLPVSCQSGFYDKSGKWYQQKDKSYTNNGNGTYTINMNPYEVVRVKTNTSTNDIASNLALGKTATMNTTPYSGHPASNAIDGDESSYAQSNTNTSWSLTIDLGSNHTIDSVFVSTDKDSYAKQFTIQTSSDNANWATVATENNGCGDSRRKYTFASQSKRYVRIVVTSVYGGGSSWGHAIREVGVYNAGSVTTVNGYKAARLKNRWQANTYLYENNGQVKYGNVTDTSAQWIVEGYDSGYLRLRNAATGHYMNNEHLYAYVEAWSPMGDQWSAQWAMTNPEGNYFKFTNRWKGTAINIENLTGYAQCSPMDGQWSAQWIIEAIN